MDSADYFADFTEKFQRDEPLIRLLFPELRKLIILLAGLILNEKGAVAMAKSLYPKLLDNSSNRKSLADILLSCNYLKDVEESHKKSFLMRVQSLQSFSFLLAKRYLIEEQLCRTPESRCCHLTARSLKDIEWKLVQLEKDPDLEATTRVE